MWQRSELKTRAKQTMNLCYWQAVLAALVLGLSGGGTRFQLNFRGNKDNWEKIIYGYDLEKLLAGLVIVLTGMAMLSVIGLVVWIFVLSPLEIGCRRFFLFSRVQKTELNELGFGFTHCYSNIVKVQFLRRLYTFLWSLLFVIPGIIKAYEYRMIPFLLAENPELSAEEAFRISRELMDGEKWNAFVLDLSFLGWIFLSIFTCGLLIIFYVSPYMAYTDAELYITLQNNRYNRYNSPEGYRNMGNPYGENSPYVDNNPV